VSPEPPYCSGINAARKPALVSASTEAVGYSRSRSSARQYSPGKPAHKPRTEAGICSVSPLSPGVPKCSFTLRHLGAAIVDRDNVAFGGMRTKTHDRTVPPHLGADAL